MEIHQAPTPNDPAVLNSSGGNELILPRPSGGKKYTELEIRRFHLECGNKAELIDTVDKSHLRLNNYCITLAGSKKSERIDMLTSPKIY